MAKVKFFKGTSSSLPATGVDGSYYQCTNDGSLYYYNGTSMVEVGSHVHGDLYVEGDCLSLGDDNLSLRCQEDGSILESSNILSLKAGGNTLRVDTSGVTIGDITINRDTISTGGNLDIGDSVWIESLSSDDITCSETLRTKGLVIGGTKVTATATEINKLDGLTATTTELNFVDGVTSNIQSQLNTKLTVLNGCQQTATGQFDAFYPNSTNANSLIVPFTVHANGQDDRIECQLSGLFVVSPSINNMGKSVDFVYNSTPIAFSSGDTYKLIYLQVGSFGNEHAASWESVTYTTHLATTDSNVNVAISGITWNSIV